MTQNAADKLLHLAMLELYDQCPPEPQQQLCRYSTVYYEGICDTCWTNCLYAAYNGESGAYTDKKLQLIP